MSKVVLILMGMSSLCLVSMIIVILCRSKNDEVLDKQIEFVRRAIFAHVTFSLLCILCMTGHLIVTGLQALARL